MLVPVGTRVTFAMSSLGYGWTITLYLPTYSSGFTVELPIALRLAAKLGAATNTETKVTFARLQNASQLRQGQVVPVPPVSSGTGTGTTPQVAAFLRLYNTARSQTKLIFFRGLSADAITAGGIINPASTFAVNINAFVAQMVTDNWQWLAKDPLSLPPQQVTAVAANPNGFPIITFGGPIFSFPIPPGTKKQVLNLSGLKGCDTLNGTFVVFPTAANICTFEKQVLFNPWLAPSGFGHSNAGVLVPAAAAIIERFAERKCGRPLYLSRGRSTRKRVVF